MNIKRIAGLWRIVINGIALSGYATCNEAIVQAGFKYPDKIITIDCRGQ